jgi:hypothetical protein
VEQDDITVQTKQSVTYDFLKGNYRIQGDSLLGFQIIGDSFISKRVEASLSLADISSIETKHFSAWKAFVYIVGVPLGLIVIYLCIAISVGLAHTG